MEVYSPILVRLVLIFGCCLFRGAVEGKADNWKEDMNDEEMEIRKFAMENGLWTPDPKVLVGPPEPNSIQDASEWGDTSGGAAVFITRNMSVVSVQVGSPASLPCTIMNVHSSETVSWIRRHDSHLLSLGDQTYSSDERFTAKHDPDKQTWTLTIQHAKLNDSGEYECQLSSHPPRAIVTVLTVMQSVSEIAGSPDKYVNFGSNVTLVCALRHFTRPPAYVFWFHGQKMINYDSERKVAVSIQGGESRLLLMGVTGKDSGNYTCQPANSMPSSIRLHILPEKSPAAMHGGTASVLHPSLYSCTALMLLLLMFSSLMMDAEL